MRHHFLNSKVVFVVTALGAVAAFSTPAISAQSKADAPKLPKPCVSRAIGAVVLPIDRKVRKAFKLSTKDNGVLVVSVKPNGFAAKNGIKAGDVLRSIKGYKIKKPADLDSVVYYWTGKDQTDFAFDVGHGGNYSLHKWQITRADYVEVIDTSTISTWESWSTEIYSFSYSEYYAEYSTEVTESFSTSETMVEAGSIVREFFRRGNVRCCRREQRWHAGRRRRGR